MGEEEGLLFFVNITFLTITCFCRGIYLASLPIYSLSKAARSTGHAGLSVCVLQLSLLEVASLVPLLR